MEENWRTNKQPKKNRDFVFQKKRSTQHDNSNNSHNNRSKRRMTLPEINKILDSGKYFTPSKREKLEKQRKELQDIYDKTHPNLSSLEHFPELSISSKSTQQSSCWGKIPEIIKQDIPFEQKKKIFKIEDNNTYNPTHYESDDENSDVDYDECETYNDQDELNELDELDDEFDDNDELDDDDFYLHS